MGAPRFLVYNFFNDRQYPLHVLSSDESTADSWKPGALRRSPDHYLAWLTAAAAHSLTVDCAQSRLADMLVVDRVTNLAGLANLKLQKSNDNFAVNIVDVATFTIPAAASGDNTALSAGVRTPEGAFLLAFTGVSERYWRLLIPASAGFVPYLGGFYVGPSWTPPNFSLPMGEDDQAPLAEEVETPWGWSGTTQVVPRREGSFLLKLKNEPSYLTADDHIRDQYVRRPMWIVPDDAKAERAFLARWSIGVVAGFRAEGGGYRPRQIRLPYREYEPLVA